MPDLVADALQAGEELACAGRAAQRFGFSVGGCAICLGFSSAYRRISASSISARMRLSRLTCQLASRLVGLDAAGVAGEQGLEVMAKRSCRVRRFQLLICAKTGSNGYPAFLRLETGSRQRRQVRSARVRPDTDHDGADVVGGLLSARLTTTSLGMSRFNVAKSSGRPRDAAGLGRDHPDDGLRALMGAGEFRRCGRVAVLLGLGVTGVSINAG